MNTFFYIIIFIAGILFGSFYTLAVYRIPKKQDITHTHSYCPNCNSKLGFFELIPVLSYLILRGRCKHCKNKIRPRYFILEILSGILFIIFAFTLKLNIYKLSIHKMMYFIFIILYLTYLILIAGINKENKTINKSVLAYGIIISIIYMIYLYVIQHASIYRYVIYFALLIILFIMKKHNKYKSNKNVSIIQHLILIIVMLLFTGELVTIISTFLSLFIMLIYLLYNKYKKINKGIPMGFFLCVSNILTFLLYTNCIK